MGTGYGCKAEVGGRNAGWGSTRLLQLCPLFLEGMEEPSKPQALGCRRSCRCKNVGVRVRQGSDGEPRGLHREVQSHPRMPSPRTASSASTKTPLFTGQMGKYGSAGRPARLLPRVSGRQNPWSHHSFTSHPLPQAVPVHLLQPQNTTAEDNTAAMQPSVGPCPGFAARGLLG